MKSSRLLLSHWSDRWWVKGLVVVRALGVLLACVLLPASGLAPWATPSEVEAAGIIHVPMSWCVVIGSPAEASPNIQGLGLLDPSTGLPVDPTSPLPPPDTDTNAIIWRRHERATDYIYLQQAQISLRSSINNVWTSFEFPRLTDPDTARGTVGDVIDPNRGVRELNDLANACDAAYVGMGRAGIGITAINIGLFHDNADPSADSDGNTELNYVKVAGYTGCNEPSGRRECVVPLEAYVMMVDNHYLYPTVADRTWPPPFTHFETGDRSFRKMDPLEILTAHEVGHALGLDHRDDPGALMGAAGGDTNNDNTLDATDLDPAEVNTLRANASNVPGKEEDPQGIFEPGRWVAMRLVDQNPDKHNLPYLDLASVKVAFDREEGQVHMGQKLMGLIPSELPEIVDATELAPSYAFLVDTDNDAATGATRSMLKELGIPSSFKGADLVALARVTQKGENGSSTLDGQVWIITGGEDFPKLIKLDPELFEFQLHTLRMDPFVINGEGPIPEAFVAEVNHTVNLVVNNANLVHPIELDQPFRVQAVVIQNGQSMDKLDDKEQGGEFVMELPSFPHCFPQEEGVPGGAAQVTFEGLLPQKAIHALLGPVLVLEGVTTDAQGNGAIDLPIPAGTPPGPHLVTIGHEGLALTADCTVTVAQPPDRRPPKRQRPPKRR